MARMLGPGDCVFCLALSRPHPLARAYDTPLGRSGDTFVIMPALGALVPGHVLLVSRLHVSSLASTGEAGIAEYKTSVDQVLERYGLEANEILEAEHGATELSPAGGCISHAHINLMPGLQACIDVMDGALSRLEEPQADLSDLAAVATPYIMLKSGADVRFFNANGAPSQMIRRRICQRLGREDWDWALFPHHDNIDATLHMWSNDVGTARS